MSKPSKHRATPKVEISAHLSELENLESELFQTEGDPFFSEDMPFCFIQEEFLAVHRAMVSTIKSARENLAKEKELMQRLRHGPWESEEEEDLAIFADENSAEYARYIEWHEIIYHMIAPATAMTLFVFFVEKTLKDIYFYSFDKQFHKEKSGLGTVEQLARAIYRDDKARFAKLKFASLRHCIRLRNAFSHGNWDSVERQLSTFRFASAYNEFIEMLRDIGNYCKDQRERKNTE